MEIPWSPEAQLTPSQPGNRPGAADERRNGIHGNRGRSHRLFREMPCEFTLFQRLEISDSNLR